MWEKNVEIDGVICRNSSDCSLIDNHLDCDDKNFTTSEIKVTNRLKHLGLNYKIK